MNMQNVELSPLWIFMDRQYVGRQCHFLHRDTILLTCRYLSFISVGNIALPTFSCRLSHQDIPRS